MKRKYLIPLYIFILNFAVQAKDPSKTSGEYGRTIDSLETLLKTTKVDTLRIDILNTLAWKLRFKKPDSSLYLCSEALGLAEQIQYANGMAASYHTLGVLNKRTGKYNHALNFFREEEKIRKELGDKILNSNDSPEAVTKQEAKCRQSLAKTYTLIGLTYWEQGNYPQALKWSLKAVRVYEELGDSPDSLIARSSKMGLATFSNNVGNIYYSQGDYREATDQYLKSLKLQEELHNKKGMATSCNNIGVMYENRGKYPEALKWYKKAVKIDKEQGLKRGLARDYLNLGSLYIAMADSASSTEKTDSLLREAMMYLQKSLTLVNKMGQAKGFIYVQIGIASVLGKMNRYSEAVIWYKKAIVIADSIGLNERLMVAYKGLAEAYFRLGEDGANVSRTPKAGNDKQYYRETLKYYKLFSQVKDNLFNEDKSKEIGKLEAKYEFEKAEADKKRLAIEELRVKNDLKQRRDNLQYSAIKLGFNAILAALIFPLHSLFERKLKDKLVKANI